MSPIDDELRTALHRRATGVTPAADPLAGIERRAGRLRRNRLAASLAGSVLAVAAVATAVPLLTAQSRPDAPPVALAPTDPPSASPGTAAPTASYALRPSAPWPYRGTPLAELGTGTLDTIAREYATKRGVAAGSITLTPLWGQVHEPSGQAELVFLAVVDGEARWGLAQASESGPELRVDEPLPEPPLALAAALPGDEVARLVVVAAPTAGTLQYGPDLVGEDATLTALAPGVGTIALEGDPAEATYRVLDAAGTVLLRAEVPDVAGPDGEAAGPTAPEPGGHLTAPSNAVDWPLRGEVPVDQERFALARAADMLGVTEGSLGARMLFGAEHGGRFYGVAQVWSGGDARFFSWRSALDDPEALAASLHLPTAPGPAACAVTYDDVLVVVPEPLTGQVFYAPDAQSEPEPVPDQGTEAAVLIERPDGTSGDHLLILDGDGDPERPLYRGTVDELLATS